MNGYEKFNETQLPSIEKFYSHLKYSSVSEEDYKRAQEIWKLFDMKTMRDYHDLYLETDTVLLADVFENFRDVCIRNYKLDPAWYFTSPGLAWDAMLRMTKIELELLSDVDMLIMIEKGIRGGISTATKRYAKANNPYTSNFNPAEPMKYIQYLDANNLYGYAMSKPLPTHGFRWMTDKELEKWVDTPCFIEVDFNYPNHLHDFHNDFPLACERKIINNVEKLMPNLFDKTNYVVHQKTLKLYQRLGLEIVKIHRGIIFNESDWLKIYIDTNTKLRMTAKNDFEKDFFKLMNNSVFGKTMENIRNRVDIKFVTDKKQAAKLINKPNFERRTIFSKKFVAIPV